MERPTGGRITPSDDDNGNINDQSFDENDQNAEAQQQQEQRYASNGISSNDDTPRVKLILESGEEVLTHAAVVATEAPAAAALLGGKVLEGGARPSAGRASTCLYFALDGPAPVRH